DRPSGLPYWRSVLLITRYGDACVVPSRGGHQLCSRSWFRLTCKEQSVSLQECALPFDFQHFKSLAALGNNLQTAVLVLFCHCDNFRCTPDFGYTFILCPDHAEQTLASQALADHLLVTGLEDVERQGDAGK